MASASLPQPTEPKPLPRHAFITIGATASFKPLLTATLSAPFIASLLSLGYSHLTLQCGPDLEYCSSLLQDMPQSALKIRVIDFNKMGLGQEMRFCKAVERSSKEGVVVCHAGAGTILDAMRIDVPIIVVPNPALLDNHQAELAEELQRQGYVVYGALGNLSAALQEIEKKSDARKAWNTIPEVQKSGARIRQGVGPVLDEELGYEDKARFMEG